MLGNAAHRKPQKQSHIGPFILNCYEWMESLVFAVIILAIVFTFFFRVVNVSGPSMLPSLQSNDRVLISMLFHEPQEGDVIVITRTQGLTQPSSSA